VAVPVPAPRAADSLATAVDTTRASGMERLDADSLATGRVRRPGAR